MKKSGKGKVCFAFEDKKPPTWPVTSSAPSLVDPSPTARPMTITGDVPLDPILAAMQAAGYLQITSKPPDYSNGENLSRDTITPTEQAKGWWNIPDGFCVGRKTVADIQEWTLPGKDFGAPGQMTMVKYTWHLTDVPSWAQRPEFKNIEGMATPVKATADLQMTNNGWKTSGDDQ